MCYLATLVRGIKWLGRDVLHTVLRTISECHPPDISDSVDRFRYFSRTRFKHVSGSEPSDGSLLESGRQPIRRTIACPYVQCNTPENLRS